MLPTMYPTGILVATLFAAAFADVGDLEPQSTANPGSTGTGTLQNLGSPLSSQHDDHDKPVQMSELCFFGKFPSATCRFRCHLMSMEAYCDEKMKSGMGMCKCRQETTPITTPEEASGDIFAKPETHMEQEAEKAKKPEEAQTPSEEATTTHEATPFTIPMQTSVQEPEENQDKHHVVFYIFDLNKIFGPQVNDTTSEGVQTEVPEPQAVPAGWAFQHFIALLIVLLLIVLISLELFACYKKQRATTNDTDSIFKNIPMPNKV